MVLNDRIFQAISSFASKTFSVFQKKLSKITKNIKDRQETEVKTKQEFGKRLMSSLMILFLYFFTIGFGGCVYVFAVLLLGMLCVFEIYIVTHSSKQHNKNIFLSCVTVIFLVTYSLIAIRLSSQGLIITFWLFMIVSVNDTVAYLFGKKFGKKKVLPSISPKKTLAGSIAGSIASVLFSLLFYIGMIHSRASYFSISMFCLLSIYATFAAQLGDAVQSKVKRELKLKNMGNLIPGHGGISDRFDSMIILAPTLAFLLIFKSSLF